MIDLIQNNPYRLVGAFVTSTKREIISNIARIKANIRVNRNVSFSSDLENLLSTPKRTPETITSAESQLTLPKDIIHHALFWYIESTEFDKIAINNLAVGSTEKAISIWDKKENLSSVHNSLITHLITGDFSKAFDLAYIFFYKYSEDFLELILGDECKIIPSNSLAFDFLDSLCTELGASEVSMYITNKEWGDYVSNKITEPLIDSINYHISISKDSKGDSATKRLNAGKKLMTETLNALGKLRSELSTTNPKYQIIADKLGLEILQCGIDYYNDSDDDDAAFKAMKLQKYAASIVVGKMAKDRCEENVQTLENIISQLPPLEVMQDHKAIQKALHTFVNQPDLIEYSITLIKSCAPHILAIKEKLGKDHEYYLKISTRIVNNALSNIIAEVNGAQEEDFTVLKSTLISAWKAQLYLDKFDVETEYKNGRYKQSREALYRIIDNCKGFTHPLLTVSYKYGCGWCNDLDVSDVDLRTDDEFFSNCHNISTYQDYINKYPNGKHLTVAKSKIEDLRFKEANTIESLKGLIKDYPFSKHVPAAKEKIMSLRLEGCKTISDYQKFLDDFPNSSLRSVAITDMNNLVRQENAISSCKHLSDIISLYNTEKGNHINVDKCSIKALELATSESDLQTIISTFGVRSCGGQKARARLDEIKRIRQEKKETREKILKRCLWVGLPILILIAIYFIWGVRGFAVGCTIIAIISGFIAFGILRSGDTDGCGTFFIFAAIAAVFGFSAAGLHEWADDIEKDEKSKVLYEQISKSPTEDACSQYIRDYYHSSNANTVREIWLNLLMKESREFDFASYEGSSLYSTHRNSKNPIQKLRNFIEKNEGSKYENKAKLCVESICDSLYQIADYKSTTAGWKQYQKVVPTDYFRDSDQKIQSIESKAWNTESKAWKQATSINTISAYEKYKSLYPYGAHIKTCQKRLIDMEVSRIYAGNHGTLPEMDRIGYGGGSTSYITVQNSTSYTLTLLYSGPDSKKLVIRAGGSSSVRLKNGNYRVAASVSASNVSNYAGNETLRGGDYSVDYYISTYRY